MSDDTRYTPEHVGVLLAEMYLYDGTTDPGPMIEGAHQALAQLSLHMHVVAGLANDLADVLARTVVGWESVIGADLAQAPDVQRVMARFRDSRYVLAPYVKSVPA